MFGGFQVGAFQTDFQQVGVSPTPTVGGTGLGHRSMRSLAKYKAYKRKELKDAIAALYETPQAEAIAQIVRPFSNSEAEFPLEAIDWKALRADIDTVSRIVDLYVLEQEEAEDEMVLFGL